LAKLLSGDSLGHILGRDVREQLTTMMAFFHQGPHGPTSFQDELNVLNAHHGGNQYLLYRLGVGERGHFFEKSEIFAMKSE
jgi:hypothetical protein